MKTELVSQEFVVFWGKEGVNGGKLPFYYVGPAIDADTVYDQYFRSGTTKRVEYKNPEVDKLIDEEQRTGDLEEAQRLQQVSRILMEDAALVPLYTLAELYGVARNVIWKARPDEKILRRNEDSLETVHAASAAQLAELLDPANFLQAITLLSSARPVAFLRMVFSRSSFPSDDFVTQTHIFARKTQEPLQIRLSFVTCFGTVVAPNVAHDERRRKLKTDANTNFLRECFAMHRPESGIRKHAGSEEPWR